MLLIQDICLSWTKEERSFAYAKKRAEFPLAYLLEQFPDIGHSDVMVQRLDFWQRGILFRTLHRNDAYGLQFYNSVQDLNLTNLTILWDNGSYEVTFFYDENRSGQPIRRGHNKDFHNMDSLLYRHDVLNERAFSLEQGQYGRVIWNERKIDYDTRAWYYQMHISNLLHDSGEMLKPDIFLISKPDFEYEQMAVLY